MAWGPFDLTGKAAVITGGARGIGFGVAARFVEAGADVLIADLDSDGRHEAIDRLSEGGRAAFAEIDVSEDGAGDRAASACVQRFGSLDILVNNAGIFPAVPFLEMPPETFDRVLAVNLRGLVFMARAAVARFVEQGTGGKIVNMASVEAFHPFMIGLTAYASSKGAVISFTRSLALEVARHGILVNAIAPGGIVTEGVGELVAPMGLTAGLLRSASPEALASKFPLGRMGAPDDVAKVAVFLASSAADYITGETIVVDGGLLLA